MLWLCLTSCESYLKGQSLVEPVQSVVRVITEDLACRLHGKTLAGISPLLYLTPPLNRLSFAEGVESILHWHKRNSMMTWIVRPV